MVKRLADPLPCGFSRHIGRSSHHAKVHPGQVFPDDAQRQQLRAGKDRDHGGQKRKSWDTAAINQIAPDDIAEYAEAKEGERESN